MNERRKALNDKGKRIQKKVSVRQLHYRARPSKPNIIIIIIIIIILLLLLLLSAPQPIVGLYSQTFSGL